MKRQDFFTKWAEELQGNKFVQVTGVLFEFGKRKTKRIRCCVLGSACVVSNDTQFIAPMDLKEANKTGSLPESLAKRLNITVEGKFTEPVKYNGEEYRSLMMLNDEAKAPFKAIAKIIVEQAKARNFEPYKGY